MNAIEIIGFITAVLGIYFSAKKNIFAWPVLIVSSLAYAFFFFEIKLYADALLQFFFVATSLLAWYHWNKENKQHNELRVKNLSFAKLIAFVFFALILGKAFGFILNKYTDATYADYDSILFASSILASILSAKLFLENWYLWILINFSYIILYIQKEAYLTAFLYFILLVIALIGLRDWKKQTHA